MKIIRVNINTYDFTHARVPRIFRFLVFQVSATDLEFYIQVLHSSSISRIPVFSLFCGLTFKFKFLFSFGITVSIFIVFILYSLKACLVLVSIRFLQSSQA